MRIHHRDTQLLQPTTYSTFFNQIITIIIISEIVQISKIGDYDLNTNWIRVYYWDLYPAANLAVVIVVVAKEVSSEEKCHISLVSS